MSYKQLHEDNYLKQLYKAAPHTPQEPCLCTGDCKSSNCDGNIIGCDCDIDYVALARLQNIEPVLPMYNVRRLG